MNINFLIRKQGNFSNTFTNLELSYNSGNNILGNRQISIGSIDTTVSNTLVVTIETPNGATGILISIVYIFIMNESNIFKLIIDTMIFCQNKTVDDKKMVAMQMIRKNISAESYHRYEPYISLSIDVIKSIAKNPEMLNELKSNNCLTCCIKKIYR